MLTIGLTGPTGAGKTTVLRALEELGFVGVDCDALYHRLLETSPALRRELTDRFGGSILNNQGRVDRPALAGVVFSDPQALLDLNAIAHRHVIAACDVLRQDVEEEGARGIVFDAAALLEAGMDTMCDLTIAVTAPAEVRLERIMARDGIAAAAAKERMAAQKPDEYYVNHCDHTIVNDGTKSFQSLAEEVARLIPDELC